jgi:hypothetical protein
MATMVKTGVKSAIHESISLPGLEGCYPAAVKRDSQKVYYGKRKRLIAMVTAIA